MAINIGDKKVSKIYLGDKLIMESKSGNWNTLNPEWITSIKGTNPIVSADGVYKIDEEAKVLSFYLRYNQKPDSNSNAPGVIVDFSSIITGLTAVKGKSFADGILVDHSLKIVGDTIVAAVGGSIPIRTIFGNNSGYATVSFTSLV